MRDINNRIPGIVDPNEEQHERCSTYAAIVPQLTAWAGGAAATRLIEQPEHALIGQALAAPVEDTLFLAGAATNTDGHTGTVHGAMATGRRAACDILSRAPHIPDGDGAL